CVRLKFVERLFEQIDTDVVEERDELFLLPFPCCFPYALQRMWHAGLALCPGHGLLARISLGPRPWLHWLRCGQLCRGSLRSGLLGLGGRVGSCYGGGRLRVGVRRRVRLVVLPMRAGPRAGRDGQARGRPAGGAILVRVMWPWAPGGRRRLA